MKIVHVKNTDVTSIVHNNQNLRNWNIIWRQDGDNCEENVSELMEEQGNTEFDRNPVMKPGKRDE